MKVPIGFRFSGAHAGLKPVRRDVALIVSDVPAVAAGCFTQNLAAAAPILDARPRVPSAAIRAVLVNSGNANAMTGPAGVADVVAIREALGTALGVGADAVLTASTGMIGVRLAASKVIGAVPALVTALTVVPEPAAEAILTTDTRTKLAFRTLELGGREVTISAIAKGSGMIAPQLATMIAIVTTDAAISPAMLDRALRDAIDPSFHCLVVDGDMSTNDTIIALANGQARNARIEAAGAELAAFTAALTSLCTELARDIASDGEGATRLLEVAVTGAPDVAVARDIARSIAASSLVKAAIFGADPNWGRVLATVGARAGSQHYAIDPHRTTVAIQGVTVFAKGEPALTDAPALRSKMRAPEVRVEVELATGGGGTATAWGCDLGYDYVKLNADYSSLIVQTADGGLAKDDRLTNYSPSFKRKLIVEALSYISRFSGTRCVIKFGGSALSKPALEQAFCDDIKLLRSVGLQPIVVHGGSAEVTRTLERLGHPTPEFVEGVRVTSPSDLKVVDMALGSINSHLVSLLNLDGAHALGISGKDGALFRAKKKVSETGRDLGLVGEISQVNGSVIEMLLNQGYVPVISPIALGEDGQGYNISADEAASAIAIALKAQKLLYLIDAPGITEHGELVTDLSVADLERKLATAESGMRVKLGAMIDALRGGVGRVHVIDGRTPHNLIAELFTDRGVGSLVTLDGDLAAAATLGGAQ
ncbi:MAG TPA: bifunctional glutamate N-acetyltransferase/amino-acid acetyltransferase ArgJ [Kofleriaceae bacterium]|nr:bifunctional glutamate N-acetyltransferase/amino-acid acetyltransferase ArgJ [Kofleriaceae bacterium]